MISPHVNLVLSVLLGCVFLAAAVPKLRDPQSFALTMLEYRVMPRGPSLIAARVLPKAEAVLGVGFLAGVGSVYTALLGGALLGLLLIAVTLNVIRGRDLACGCFGGWWARRVGWPLAAQDAALLIAAAAVALTSGGWGPLSVWSPLRAVPAGALRVVAGIGICVFVAVIIVRRSKSATARMWSPVRAAGLSTAARHAGVEGDEIA